MNILGKEIPLHIKIKSDMGQTKIDITVFADFHEKFLYDIVTLTLHHQFKNVRDLDIHEAYAFFEVDRSNIEGDYFTTNFLDEFKKIFIEKYIENLTDYPEIEMDIFL